MRILRTPVAIVFVVARSAEAVFALIRSLEALRGVFFAKTAGTSSLLASFVPLGGT
jgi:hypothetical protein